MREQNEDWREFLRYIFSNKEILGSLAEDMGLHQATLMRWTDPNRSIIPHRINLEQLFRSPKFPAEHRSRMESLLQKQFPDFQAPPQFLPEPMEQQRPVAIPTEFLLRVARAAALTAEEQVFSTVVQLIAQQITLHLGSRGRIRTGMFLLTPPSSQKIRSMYMPNQPSAVRLASLPKLFPVLAGIESMLSTTLRFSTTPMLFSSQEMPMPLSLLPELAAVCCTLIIPLQKHGKIAGCFLLTNEQGFPAEQTEEIAAGYGYLLSLGLAEKYFYPREKISLAVLPPLEAQVELEKQSPFHERMKRLSNNEHTLEELEIIALQELEQELIEMQQKETEHGSKQYQYLFSRRAIES